MNPTVLRIALLVVQASPHGLGRTSGLDQRDGLRCNALATPSKPEALGGFGLDVDLGLGDAQSLGYTFDHRRDVWCHARGLCHDRRVQIHDREPVLTQLLSSGAQ